MQRRRRHLPDRASIIRLVGAFLVEQYDEWVEGRRYLGLDVLTSAQAIDEKAEAVRLARAGVSMRAISRRMGADRKGVRLALVEAGVIAIASRSLT